jgi:putative ABC transport system substrate-binding protein
MAMPEVPMAISASLRTGAVNRRGATYVDRILRGAKPGDLPVQFPTKFEMAVNLVPPSIMLRATEVIE